MDVTLDLVRSALPEVPLSAGVQQATTGVVLLDSLPLLTMLPCTNTLAFYWKRKRHWDFALFFAGFCLALVYHVLHMHPEGIANTELLGISGPTWRGLDILMAQALLARTLGHALGARSGAVQALANLVFPAVLLGYTHLLADGVLTLGFASKVLVAVLLATLGAKAALEGFDTLPRYCPRRGRRTLAAFAAAFAAFPLPEIWPTYYFLFHSIWHLCLAEGYLLLYQQLEGVHLQGSCAGTASGASQPADSQADSASSEEEEEASEGEAEVVVAAAAGGWAAALLQPARQLLRFQRRSGSARRGQAADSKAGKAL